MKSCVYMSENIEKTTVKSPLRYPGGKSRATKILYQLVPNDTKEICSPFFGGGSFEIYCAQKGIKVYGYDNFKPLVDFWQCLLEDSEELANEVERHYPLPKAKFYEYQKMQIESKSKLERAVLFYVLNRTSFSGSTLSGGMASGGLYDNPRFNKSSIERLRKFMIENLTVGLADFSESIKKHKKTLLYIDPPYMIKSKLYGRNGDLHKDFDHEGLSNILKKRGKWILSYNDSNEVKDLYANFHIEIPKWAYGMSNNKFSRELIILSDDIAKHIESTK